MKKNKIGKSILKFVFNTTVSLFSLFLCLFATYFALDNIELFTKEAEASLFNSVNIEHEETIVANTEEEKYLVPLGSVFGVKLYTDGVIVSSMQNINVDGENICPAKLAGIMEGDFILSIEGEKIKNNEHFTELLSKYVTEEITLEIKRDSQTFTTSLKAVYDGEYYRLGMWIKDSAAGIGTLTFYDPATDTFGGLGHGIYDIDSGNLMSLKGGEPVNIEISHIEKATETEPGKICGYFSSDDSLGELYINNDTGVFGSFYDEPQGVALPVASASEIKIGKATIISTIENGETKEYEIEIEKISTEDKQIKNMTIKITDEDLLAQTGGILQGMSGSPIIQDGKIVGAVTHVFVNDPTRGYGIFIENMLESAESIGE